MNNEFFDNDDIDFDDNDIDIDIDFFEHVKLAEKARTSGLMQADESNLGDPNGEPGYVV